MVDDAEHYCTALGEVCRLHRLIVCPFLFMCAPTRGKGTHKPSPLAVGRIPCRLNHACAPVGTKLAIFGGWDGVTCYNDLWVYDIGAYILDDFNSVSASTIYRTMPALSFWPATQCSCTKLAQAKDQWSKAGSSPRTQYGSRSRWPSPRVWRVGDDRPNHAPVTFLPLGWVSSATSARLVHLWCCR